MSEKQCPVCRKATTGEVSRTCGVWICDECDYHWGLCRCFCGWSLTSPGAGRQELVEMGETIEEEA